MQRITLLLLVFCISIGFAQAQTMEDLKSQIADKKAMFSDLEAQLGATQGEIDAIQKELDILSGWRKGVGGIFGFDWNRSSDWIANPNPDAQSSSLNLDATAYLLNDKEKTFWHNKLNVVKAWADVDLSQSDEEAEDDGLFDNGTVDILNLSSLAGYKLTDKFALSGQAELNSSLGNFLEPGTFDIGIGVTWLPIQNLTVLIHPLNYNIAFPADGSPASTSGSVGAKVRADYFNDFNVAGKTVTWTTTLSAFLPYTTVDEYLTLDGQTNDKTGNWTWINNLNFSIWKGIGVGLGWGIRKADFETDNTQTYTNIGLSYKI